MFAAESVQAPELVFIRIVLTRPSVLFDMMPLHSPKPSPMSLRRRVPEVVVQLNPPDMVNLPLSDWKFISEPPVLPRTFPLIVLEPLTLSTAGTLIMPDCRQSMKIGSGAVMLPINSRRPLPVVLPAMWVLAADVTSA